MRLELLYGLVEALLNVACRDFWSRLNDIILCVAFKCFINHHAAASMNLVDRFNPKEVFRCSSLRFADMSGCPKVCWYPF